MWKVGDTITANVEPSDATNVAYAWYMGSAATQVEDVIADATTASLKVTDAMVGKYIKVVATGEEGSSQSAITTAPVAAEEGAKLAIASAKQTKAAEFEVTFNKAISTSGYDITVTRGSTAQTVTTVLDETGMTAKVSLATAIQAADYTIKVTSKTDATETASTVVKGEIAALKSIDFLGNELILTSSALKEASVTLVGYNQFEEKVALSGSLTVTSTKGTAKYESANTKVVVKCGDNIFFTVGEQVTVTGVYTAGTTILQVSKALTVSNVATLTKLELGDITTSRTALKDKKVDINNLATGTYYFPVKVAEDQYGNKLSASDLDTMMIKADETDATQSTYGNLYITPNQSSGTYAYIDGFTEATDGTIQMNVKLGGLKAPGTAVFSITGVSGFSGTKELVIEDNPFIATLNVSAPTFYGTTKDEITMSAVDQYGNALDLYEVGVDVGNSTGAAGLFTKLALGDKNNLTKGQTTIEVKDGRLSYTVDTSKKTIKFYYTPNYTGTNNAAQTENVTIQTATPTAGIQQWTIQPAATVAGIKSFDGATSVKVNEYIATNDYTKFTWLDSNGATMSKDKVSVTGTNTATTVANNPGTITGAPSYEYVVKSSTTAFTVEADGRLKAASTADIYQSNITVTLNKIERDGTGKVAAVTALKSITFIASIAGTPKTYTATLDSSSSLLYVNPNSADASGFSVNAVDANGVAIAFTGYTVTVDSDLTVDGQKVSGKASGISTKGTAVATIWVGGKAEATVDVPYDVAAPVAQKTSVTDNAEQFTEVTKLVVNSNGSVTITGKGDNATVAKDYTLAIVDQYGLPMANTKWALKGSDVKTEAGVTLAQAALTATSAKVSGSWTVSGTTVNITGSKEAAATGTDIKSEDELVSALAAANDEKDETFVISNSFNTTAAFTLKAGDTIVVKNGVTFNASTAVAANTIQGTIDIYGIMIGKDEDDISGKLIVEEGGAYNNTGNVKATGAGSIENAGTVSLGNIAVGTVTKFNGAGSYTGTLANNVTTSGLYTSNAGLFELAVETAGCEKVVLTGNITIPNNSTISEALGINVAANRIHRVSVFEIALNGNTLDLGNNALMFNGYGGNTAYKISSDRAGGKVTSSAYYTVGIQMATAANVTAPVSTLTNVTIANTSDAKNAAALLIWDDEADDGYGIDLVNWAATLSATSGNKVRIEIDKAPAQKLTWTKAATPATGQGTIAFAGAASYKLPTGLAETSVSYATATTIAMDGGEDATFNALESGTATDSALADNADVIILVK